MRYILIVLATFAFGSLHAQFAGSKPAVRTTDFTQALGAWKGSLTYLDYSSGKPFTMPANVTLRNSANANEIILVFDYPQEPKANGNDTLHIINEGMEIEDAAVVSKEVMADGILQIITEKNGVDGNDRRKAVLRHIYLVGKTVFSTRKEVKFDGEEKWIMRNEFSFTR